jgi:hypothetical protein
VTVAEVRNVVAVSEYAIAGDVGAQGVYADETGRVLDRWVQGVTQWLEVLAGIDVQPGRWWTASVSPQFVSALPIQVDESGGLSSFATLSQAITGVTHTIAASRSQWDSSVTHANLGDEPSAELLLLRDARAALRRRLLRKAVIDAGTATEVGLASAIRERLDRIGSSDRETIEQVLKNCSGVVELFDLLVALGYPPPMSRRRVMDQLAEKRNRAAHGGTEPSKSDARAALQVAEVILASLPLSHSGDRRSMSCDDGEYTA